MRAARGQALLELALCAPVVVLLAVGTVAAVQAAGARAGLESATQAAAEAAARAPDAATAVAIAHDRFQRLIADYPVRSATLAISVGDFHRSGKVTATSSAAIDIGWAAFLPGHLILRSQVVLQLEQWRSHSA